MKPSKFNPSALLNLVFRLLLDNKTYYNSSRHYLPQTRINTLFLDYLTSTEELRAKDLYTYLKLTKNIKALIPIVLKHKQVKWSKKLSVKKVQKYVDNLQSINPNKFTRFQVLNYVILLNNQKNADIDYYFYESYGISFCKSSKSECKICSDENDIPVSNISEITQCCGIEKYIQYFSLDKAEETIQDIKNYCVTCCRPLYSFIDLELSNVDIETLNKYFCDCDEPAYI
ncbi:hypothetical protein [Rachiplusia nu nucleopolyhedrovirus]|uniref:Uncharacterized protein n=1 Tax=Rachiplusia nu nucleopolyhedrovirus TaxID=2605775 RepID=A0AAE6M6D7_9ABAC|nr:hypothetical protein QKQ55_gp063 [Rachiplusia nu nucleopolyhedrovirus]QEI03668.1 hypothetical protein [Rachiplusia nu nucleopolyhedrovirus]